jgi:hypothetical protein
MYMSRPIQYCIVPECKERRVGRGYCRTHYMRWKRHGDPAATPRFCGTEERFWRYVDKSQGDCWVWTGALSRGYGRFVVKQRPTVSVASHRYAYELTVGPIPEGLTIDHLCRNKSCVKPRHLEPVTMRINVLRNEGPSAKNAKKTQCDHGHPFSETNTYVYAAGPRKGVRKCRVCERLRMQLKRQSSRLCN